MNIKNIAKLAGVSVSSISRYINTPHLLKTSTRNKIKKVVEEVNYHPSPMAQGMRFKRTKNLILLLETMESPFFTDVLFGAEQAAVENDYNLLIVNINKDQNKKEVCKNILFNRNFDGVVFCCDTDKSYEKLFKSLIDNEIQIAFINNEDYKGKLITVSTNNHKATFDGTQYLIDKGHKEIALVTCNATYFLFDRRKKGYQDALLKNTLDFNTSYVYETDLSIDGGQKIAEIISKDLNKYTAIFCLSDFVALGMLNYFYENNINVPEDISLMGFDDISYTKISVPPLTTIHQKKKKLGYLAVEKLISHLNGKSKGIISISLDTYLVERKSVKDINRLS